MMNWTLNDIPPQEGKIAIVTGANSGLGYYTARGLAAGGAEVIMACRNQEKGEAAVKRILMEDPRARVVLKLLDLADLGSVRSFAEEFKGSFKRLDLLVNNAGLMAIPYRKTVDGFEMQFGVNHLGHFALTGLLIPMLEKAEGARVVNVSSLAHRMGKIRFEDLHWEKKYSRWRAYGMSKLANLLFTQELQERFDRHHMQVLAVAAHPGYADSNLIEKGPEMNGIRWMVKAARTVNRLFAQSTGMGALPTLYAAVSEDVEPAGFYGPDGFRELKGFPVKVSPAPGKMDPAIQKRLWKVSEELTGISFLDA